METRIEMFTGTHLTCYRGIRLSQLRLNSAGLLLSRIKGRLEDPKTNL